MFLALVVTEQMSFETIQEGFFCHNALLQGGGTRRSCGVTVDAQCDMSF